MWSTHVAGLMMPARLHSAHSGCSARKALLSRVHRAVWYGFADLSREYFPSLLSCVLCESQGSFISLLVINPHYVGPETSTASCSTGHQMVLVCHIVPAAITLTQPHFNPAAGVPSRRDCSQPTEPAPCNVVALSRVFIVSRHRFHGQSVQPQQAGPS